MAITSMADLDRLVAEGKIITTEATHGGRAGAAAVQGIGTEVNRPATTWMRSTPSPGKTAAEISPPRWARQPRPGAGLRADNGRIGESFKGDPRRPRYPGAAQRLQFGGLKEYLAAAFNQAKNKAEIDAVIRRMKAMAKQGQLTGDYITRSMAIAADP